jgi:S-DNA-T family DNA segregation ATPase FtsK/SpoIIIE
MRTFLQINNPNKQITVAGLKAHNEIQSLSNKEYSPVSDEEQNADLYSEDEYFYHIPRVKESVEIETVKIDAPPGSEKENDLPFLLTIGTTITMGASTMMMGYNVVYSMISGTRSIWLIIPQIIMCLAMIFGSLIIPKMLAKYQKKKRKEREELRQIKYTKYLGEKDQNINLVLKKQIQIMKDNSISIPNCSVIISSNNRNFWGREITDDDFLTVRLGIGSMPAPIKIEAPEKSFTLDEDNLLESVYQIVDKYKRIEEVPVGVSLLEKRITSFVCECSYKDKFIDGIILQLIALHSASDLKIVVFTDKTKERRWDYMKMVPHCWSEDKSTRFFATTQEEMKEISAFLEEELKKRKEILAEKGAKSNKEGEEKVDKKDIYKNFDSYFLIINDNYREGKNIQFINDLFTISENFGFSYMVVESSMRNLPTKSEVFIQIGETEGAVLEKNINAEAQMRFKNEYDINLNMREIANKIANIPTITKEGLSVLPTSISFLEMFGVSKIEQLNILNRWKVNNPVTSLNAVVGVHANGDQFKLNLHEKFHGPHGLIAGMTGSGKSEFIITYILSMCINYHPYEVQFVLIDYKGGGLAGAFENKETGIRIPHLTGTITNLDTAEMNRTLVSIESELKRRQRIFNEARDAIGEGTIDIYKYQRLYRDGLVKEPMAHLFIISDEFAELKSQQPDFMQQLISTARIGRSLGVHLILATQKPSGVVNDQIWSNAKFKVCLKVQDRSDSMEMLKKPDAASIKEAGRFYLQVGYDDFFDKGQSGWAGAKYVPTDRIIRKVDDSIDFVNNVGYAIKSVKDIVKNETEEKDYGDQLTNIVKYIHAVGNREQLVTRKLWLDSIPAEIFINNLKAKYKYEVMPYLISPVIGEYDSPATQEQSLLCLDLTASGNTAIIGQSGSGKEQLLTTIIWSSIIDHTPEEVNFYIIDCGSESLKVFNNMPHVGAVGLSEDYDLNIDMLKMMGEEIERRKDLMADYAGSYTEYLENSGNKLPLIVTVINNYEVFLEQYGKIEENLMTLYRDGAKYGVVFILTAIAPNTIRSRIMQNFTNKMCLQLPNDADYRSYMNAPRGLFPSRIFGRGLVFYQEAAYEFQTAIFADKKNINTVIREASKTYSQAYTSRAKGVPSVPPVVTVDLLRDIVGSLKLPIGYDIDTKEPACYDFSANHFNMLVANNMDDKKMSFIYSLMQLFQRVENTRVKVIDFVEAYEKDIFGVECYKDDFDNTLAMINNEIIGQKDSNITTIYMFLGIGQYKNKLGNQGKAILNNIFQKMNTINNVYCIFIDTVSSYKNIQIEEWYQTNIDNSSGIWLEADAASQLVINAPNLTMEDRKLNFPYIAFIVSRGKHNIIKYVIEEGETGEK